MPSPRPVRLLCDVATLFSMQVDVGETALRRFGCLLFFVLGLSCWWMLIGLSLEVPAFLSFHVPEGKSIAVYLNLACQAGNLPVLLYLLVPTRFRPQARNSILCLTVLLIAASVSGTAQVPPVVMAAALSTRPTIFLTAHTRARKVCVAELWKVQVWGFSVPLLLSAGIIGTVGCMTNAVVWEYAAAYQAVFTTWLSIGMGVSSCIPSLIALVQDPGPNETFSVAAFCFMGAGLVTLALVCVLVINYSSVMARNTRKSVGSVDGTQAPAASSCALVHAAVVMSAALTLFASLTVPTATCAFQGFFQRPKAKVSTMRN